jgi:alpha-beta hydrolase superfamily lysophospholipase
LALLAGLLHPGSQAQADAFSYTAPAAELARPPGTLLNYQAIALPGVFRGKAWRILYATRDYRGKPILSSGIVVLSGYASKNQSQRPIVAWAHPTTGVARKCAPSLSGAPISSILGLNELISSGHIIAATDYPGLGTTGPMGYMVGKGQANAVIDSVRAARRIPGVGGGREYALWGYSQGGHAAAFASLFTDSYAPELKLVGMAAVAPPTQLAALMQGSLNRMEGRVLASFIIGTWPQKYGLSIDGLVAPAARADILSIDNSCVVSLADKLDILSAQKPLKRRFLLQSPLALPGWRSAIAANSISSFSTTVPAIIFQGGSDTVVDPKVTAQVVRTSCQNGARLKFVYLPGVGHGGSAKASVAQAVSWINDRFRGKPAPSNCR